MVKENKCRFFDDGHGNGSYLSGASCGPPNCSFYKEGGKAETCWGNTQKCNVNELRIAKLQKLITEIIKEI